MRPSTVKLNVEKNRIQLTKWEMVKYYFFVFFILSMPLAIMYNEYSTNGNIELSFFKMIMFLIALLLINKKQNDLKLHKYSYPHSDNDFKNAIKATALKLNWEICKFNESMLIAKKYLEWQGLDGLRITIYRINNDIYINSMVEPSSRSFPLTFGWNKKNINMFIKNLIAVKENANLVDNIKKEIKEKEYKNEMESEWNLKNSVKRVLMYSLILLFLTISAFIIIKSGFNIGVIPLLLLCFTYLYLDIKVLTKKR